MAGKAAISTIVIARSAASNINFFNLPTSLSSRGTVFYRGGHFCTRARLLPRAIAQLRPRRPRLAASRGGLVDLSVADKDLVHVLVRRQRDIGANLLELEVIRLRGVLDDIERVLGVAGVPNTLDVGALARVVALTRGRERLIEVAALAFLLILLGNLRYGRDSSHCQHRQKRS